MFTLHSQQTDWGFEWVGKYTWIKTQPFSVREKRDGLNDGFRSYLSCCHYPHSQRPSDTQFAWACHIHCTAPEERIKKNKKIFWIPGTNCCVILRCRNEMFNPSIKNIAFYIFHLKPMWGLGSPDKGGHQSFQGSTLSRRLRAGSQWFSLEQQLLQVLFLLLLYYSILQNNNNKKKKNSFQSGHG